MRSKKILKILLFSVGLFITHTPIIHAQTPSDWYMAGANPQRTSWVSEEVRGNLGVEWYQPIEPYIPYKIQPVFYNGIAFVSTAKGLYAFDLNSTVAAGGSRVKWIYPTELPLGHSPTIAAINVNGVNKVVAYVGGFDHKIHAVDTGNGQMLSGYTPFEAGAGFETNPLIIKDSFTNNTSYIIAGNRDGKLYVLNAATGAKIWDFQTGGPVLYSAAYKNGVIYFASNDLYAYAINVSNGTQKWRSQKFQYSAGFFSFWPVVYTDKGTNKDYVSFTGATNYRPGDEAKMLNILDMEYFIPECMKSAPNSCISGIMWNRSTTTDPYFTTGTTVMNVGGTSAIPGIGTYYETFPHRRMVFILDASTGTEYTYDSNGNGKPEYAPFTWANITYSGSKYPAVVNGIDNILYNTTLYQSGQWIARSDPVGWKFGTNLVSYVSGGSHAFDEPLAYSGGGKILYWALNGDREAGAYDVTMPLSTSGRGWSYYSYDLINETDLSKSKAPDYQPMYNELDQALYNHMDGWHNFAGKNPSKNAVYGKHGTAQSPPIPYQGKVYMIKGNTLFSWKAASGTPAKLATAPVSSVQNPPSVPNISILKQKLESEVQKMITAGHLRPGYVPGSLLGNGSGNGSGWQTLGDILDYFHNPADTVYTLLLAYPHLSPTLQTQVKTYLQTNYGPGAKYDFTKVTHIGWSTGAPREAGTVPPERTQYFRVGEPITWKPCCASGYWQNFSPFNFYAAWKYAQIIGNNDQTVARNIFNSMSGKIEAPTTDEFLLQKPYFTNLYAAGYLGYLELKKLAGLGGDTTVQGYYDKVLALRKNFTKDTYYWSYTQWCGATNNCPGYFRAFSVSRNFAFLTPEIAAYMKQQIPATTIQTAINEYQTVAPYWFDQKFDATAGEGTLQHLYDSPSIFQAKAWIQGQSYEELSKYLDAPAFDRGDLFYIQNLVATIQAPSNGGSGGTSGGTPTPTTSQTSTPTPNPLPGDINGDRNVNLQDSVLLSNAFGTNNSASDINQDGIVNLQDYVILSNNFGKSV
jgi:hypothetical protein